MGKMTSLSTFGPVSRASGCAVADAFGAGTAPHRCTEAASLIHTTLIKLLLCCHTTNTIRLEHGRGYQATCGHVGVENCSRIRTGISWQAAANPAAEYIKYHVIYCSSPVVRPTRRSEMFLFRTCSPASTLVRESRSERPQWVHAGQLHRPTAGAAGSRNHRQRFPPGAAARPVRNGALPTTEPLRVHLGHHMG